MSERNSDIPGPVLAADEQNERRAQILRAAERLFGRYGPGKTTMADVAREAEIAVGSVYLEFSSKEALIEELSARLHQAVLSAMRAAADQDSQPYRERLRAVFNARAEAFLEASSRGLHACDLLHCRGDASKTQAVRAVHARFRDEERVLLLHLVRRGVKSGEFKAQRPEAAASAILAAYAVFSPPVLFSMPRDELGAQLSAMHDLILYGLLKRVPEK